MFKVPEEFRISTGPLFSKSSAGRNGAFELPPKTPGDLSCALPAMAWDGNMCQYILKKPDDACAFRPGKKCVT